MENVKIRKENGKDIPVLVEASENAQKIVIMVHGFTSSKSCPTADMLFNRLPEKGIGVVTYDQPAHGEAIDDPLGVINCIDSLATVENYVAGRFKDVEIGYFGSSYGAYITALYMCTREHRGSKAFCRSAAVNMPDLILTPLKKVWSPEINDILEKQGYIEPDLGLGETVKITGEFLRELNENILYEKYEQFSKIDRDGFANTTLEFVHGEKDPVVDVNVAKSFADKFGYKFNIIEGEGHSICDKAESPDKVGDLAIEFFS